MIPNNGTSLNPVTDWWKNVAMFLAGIVVTLAGAYFANGASKKDIADAIAVQDKLSSMQMQSLLSQQAQLTVEIRQLQAQMREVSQAVGVNATRPR